MTSRLMAGISGVRGIVGEGLTPEVVHRYAGAFAAAEWLDGERPWTVDAALRAVRAAGSRLRPRLEEAFRLPMVPPKAETRERLAQVLAEVGLRPAAAKR